MALYGFSTLDNTSTSLFFLFNVQFINSRGNLYIIYIIDSMIVINGNVAIMMKTVIPMTTVTIVLSILLITVQVVIAGIVINSIDMICGHR